MEEQCNVGVVLIYPFGFIKWSWVVFLMLMSHLHCLYVRCLLITFAYFSLVVGLFLLSSRGSSYIRETVVCLYEVQKFFPSLLFVFWLCGNLFSHKEDIVFNVNELFEFVFYGFFVHIYNNPDVRCVWIKFAFLQDDYHVYWIISLFHTYLKCHLNHDILICIYFFWIFLFISTDLFICMLISYFFSDHIW